VWDPITTRVADHFTLERGLTVGLIIFVPKAAVLLVLAFDWAFEIVPVQVDIPTIHSSMVTATTIVIGLQTVFYSVFFTYINKSYERQPRQYTEFR
jgi:hypothetical protein